MGGPSKLKGCVKQREALVSATKVWASAWLFQGLGIMHINLYTPVIPFLRSRRLGLSPSLGWRHDAIELAADGFEKVWRAERPTDQFVSP